MANDKTYDRHVNIWINGKEIQNTTSAIKKEFFTLQREISKLTIGTKEYNEKAAELRKVKQIMKDHQDSIAASGGAWTKFKGLFSGAQGMIVAGVGLLTGAYAGLKGIIESTDALSDKFDVTLSGWKGGLDALFRSLASINEGGLKNLGKNIREGIEEGRRYAESLDSIDESMRALKIAEAETSNEILRQTKISRSAKSTKTEQIDAGKEIIRLEEKLAGIRTGIAQRAFENEARNIASITGLTEAEVMAYVKQDAAILAQIETGKKYNNALRDRNALQAIMSANGGKLTDSQKARWKAANEVINSASEEMLRFANAANKMPGEEKMNLFVDKYVALQQAMGSAMENTMRTQIRTDKNEVELNKKSLDGIKDKTDAEIQSALDWVEIQNDVAEYTEKLDEDYFKRQDEKKKKEQEAAIETMQIEADVREYTEKLDEDYFKRMEERKREELEVEKEIASQKMELLNGAGALESALFDRQFAKLDAQYKKDIAAAGDNAELKAKIDADYAKKKNALARKAAIADKVAALFSIGLSTAMGVANAAAKIVTLPLIPWIIANGAVQAAVVLAKPIPEFYTGGYTEQGDKYRPAGIVHAGEWVANQELVASPVTGPIIQALENYRSSGAQGYANGGAAGISAQGSAGSSPVIVGTDPELKALIRQNMKINQLLLTEGVKNNWSWKDVNNMREGMNKLGDIERDVTR